MVITVPTPIALLKQLEVFPLYFQGKFLDLRHQKPLKIISLAPSLFFCLGVPPESLVRMSIESVSQQYRPSVHILYFVLAWSHDDDIMDKCIHSGPLWSTWGIPLV